MLDRQRVKERDGSHPRDQRMEARFIGPPNPQVQIDLGGGTQSHLRTIHGKPAPFQCRSCSDSSSFLKARNEK
jgi:hypothetical protein